MKIESSSVNLSSQHTLVEKRSVEQSLRIWVGDQRPDFEGRGTKDLAAKNIMKDVVKLSNKALSSKSCEKICLDDEDEESAPTVELRMLKMMIERLLGRKIKLESSKDVQEQKPGKQKSNKPDNAETPKRQGFGVEYDYSESRYESEKTNFSAQGVINTSDGKKFSFNLNLNLSREFLIKRNISGRFGDAVKLQDPLVINFDGTSAQLTDTKFNFDIDSDGKADRISFVSPSSGFLAIDRNDDNVINNGVELFGPKTGSGFAELAKYDLDRNNWIDENDAIYDDLLIWSKDAQGNDILSGLKQKNVGAIYLGYKNTQFDLNNKENEMLGRIRTSGIYAKESGSVGTIQQVDLVS